VKVLVVEDEKPAASFLRRGLSEEGFAVDVATDSVSADEAVRVNEYDAIVLDVMLPGGSDGFALCQQWRQAGLDTPILFLTARDDVADRVRGLDRGGDDYLVKPFAFAELLARLRALLRRGRAPLSPLLRAGDLTLDANRRQVTRGGKIVPLTVREYQLLEYLVRHAGQVVSRTRLWEHVWDSHSVPDSNVVDVYVRYLRNKLGRAPDLIRTVRGGGYILDQPRDDDNKEARRVSPRGFRSRT
jgi:two-component system copper resistance phosphate regulon response regulator CusR